MKEILMNTTLTALIAKYNQLAAAAARPARKGFDNKTKALEAISALEALLKPKTSKAASLKVRKAATPRVKGPRGFKFGPVWMKSILEGKGVALKAQNMPKLLETAQFKGVVVTSDLSQPEIAAAIAKTL